MNIKNASSTTYAGHKQKRLPKTDKAEASTSAQEQMRKEHSEAFDAKRQDRARQGGGAAPSPVGFLKWLGLPESDAQKLVDACSQLNTAIVDATARKDAEGSSEQGWLRLNLDIDHASKIAKELFDAGQHRALETLILLCRPSVRGRLALGLALENRLPQGFAEGWRHAARAAAKRDKETVLRLAQSTPDKGSLQQIAAALNGSALRRKIGKEAYDKIVDCLQSDASDAATTLVRRVKPWDPALHEAAQACVEVAPFLTTETRGLLDWIGLPVNEVTASEKVIQCVRALRILRGQAVELARSSTLWYAENSLKAFEAQLNLLQELLPAASFEPDRVMLDAIHEVLAAMPDFLEENEYLPAALGDVPATIRVIDWASALSVLAQANKLVESKQHQQAQNIAAAFLQTPCAGHVSLEVVRQLKTFAAHSGPEPVAPPKAKLWNCIDERLKLILLRLSPPYAKKTLVGSLLTEGDLLDYPTLAWALTSSSDQRTRLAVGSCIISFNAAYPHVWSQQHAATTVDQLLLGLLQSGPADSRELREKWLDAVCRCVTWLQGKIRPNFDLLFDALVHCVSRLSPEERALLARLPDAGEKWKWGDLVDFAVALTALKDLEGANLARELVRMSKYPVQRFGTTEYRKALSRLANTAADFVLVPVLNRIRTAKISPHIVASFEHVAITNSSQKLVDIVWAYCKAGLGNLVDLALVLRNQGWPAKWVMDLVSKPLENNFEAAQALGRLLQRAMMDELERLRRGPEGSSEVVDAILEGIKHLKKQGVIV